MVAMAEAGSTMAFPNVSVLHNLYGCESTLYLPLWICIGSSISPNMSREQLQAVMFKLIMFCFLMQRRCLMVFHCEEELQSYLHLGGM